MLNRVNPESSEAVTFVIERDDALRLSAVTRACSGDDERPMLQSVELTYSLADGVGSVVVAATDSYVLATRTVPVSVPEALGEVTASGTVVVKGKTLFDAVKACKMPGLVSFDVTVGDHAAGANRPLSLMVWQDAVKFDIPVEQWHEFPNWRQLMPAGELPSAGTVGDGVGYGFFAVNGEYLKRVAVDCVAPIVRLRRDVPVRFALAESQLKPQQVFTVEDGEISYRALIMPIRV